MFKIKPFAVVLSLLLAALPASALVDTNEYRITFDAPLDTTFIAANNIDVNISIYDQDDQLMPGLTPVLTVRAGSGMGSVIIVNAQDMTDNNDGTYTYTGIDLTAFPNIALDIRVRLSVKSTAMENRIFVYHGADQDPAGANLPWKLKFVSPSPMISADTSTVISANLYNAVGALWSGGGRVRVILAVVDSSGGSVIFRAMTYQGNGLFTDTLDGTQLNIGADYIFQLSFGLGGPVVRTAILAEVYSNIVLPELIPVSPDPTLDPRPLMSWHPVPGATVYTLQIDDNSNFASPIINTPLSDTSYTSLIDLPVGMIYWRVASDLAPARFSDPDAFEILDADIPMLIPYSPDPTQEPRPTLTWHTVAGASSYTIQIDTLTGTFAGALVMETPTSDTFYTPTIDLSAGAVYWRVQSDLSTTYSDPDTFTILPDSIPMLVRFDGDTVMTRRPTFQWHPVTGATHYTIQISLDPAFNTTVFSTPTSDTSYTPLIDLDRETMYYWRVSSSRNNNLYSPGDSVYVGTPVDADNPEAALIRPRLYAAPNPFSSAVTVTLARVAGTVPVTMSVYDVSGRLVVRLNPVQGRAGMTAVWNGRTASGMPVRSGIYLIRVKAGRKVLNDRIMLMK